MISYVLHALIQTIEYVNEGLTWDRESRGG
jgi:hypothetical protein